MCNVISIVKTAFLFTHKVKWAWAIQVRVASINSSNDEVINFQGFISGDIYITWHSVAPDKTLRGCPCSVLTRQLTLSTLEVPCNLDLVLDSTDNITEDQRGPSPSTDDWVFPSYTGVSTGWIWLVEDEEWKNRQIAEISSIATPLLLRFHASAACSTSRLADFPLSGIEDTISTASWFVTTSHT